MTIADDLRAAVDSVEAHAFNLGNRGRDDLALEVHQRSFRLRQHADTVERVEGEMREGSELAVEIGLMTRDEEAYEQAIKWADALRGDPL